MEKQVKKYNIYYSDDLGVMYESLTEKQVVNNFNSMVSDINADCGENYSKAKNLLDVLKNQKDYGWIVKDITNTKTDVLEFVIEQALRFNSSWHGRTMAGDDRSFYDFAIKPLYINENNVIFQIELNKMCPSGLSDNGIKNIYMLNIDLLFFDNNLNKLVSELMSIVTTSKIKYVKF